MAVVETRYRVEGWGAGELWTRGGTLVAHWFAFDAATGGVSGGGGLTAPADRAAARGSRAALASDLVERVRAFLAGAADGFHDVELDLADATPFQRALTEALRAVPRGEVVTYGELAALAGRPGAHRAAGTFCAGNRFAFVVPCHRVVAADGLGGYGSAGVAVKRRLLALEGVRV